jgi:hypothetical protein
MSAGIIKDISIDGKEQDQFWIWKTDSQYSTLIKQDPTPTQKHLVFQGLDTIATIELNDNVVLTTRNMHRSYRLDVTELLRAGDVTLKIFFAAPLSDAESKLAALGTAYPRPYEMPYNYQRKMACSYGWDWGPRLVSCGIWLPVSLVEYSARITDVHVKTVANGLILKSATEGEGRVVHLLEGAGNRTVLLDGEEAGALLQGPPGEAKILSYRNTEVVVEASFPEGGYLVLNDIWHSWWAAEVDGAPAPILQANVMFRAVRMGPGVHRVRFSFDPFAGLWAQLWKR